MPDLSVDLRSDSVTHPTAEMRRAMAEAIVADDGREGDPTAQRLESMGAEMVGHEAGLFCTSGTMANLVALMAHLRPGEEVMAERDSHFLRFEAGSLSVIAGGVARTLPGRAGKMDLQQMEAEIQPGSRLRPRTALIVVENTHNMAGGACLEVRYIRELWEIARKHEIAVHLDGERIFNAAVALGVPARAHRGLSVGDVRAEQRPMRPLWVALVRERRVHHPRPGDAAADRRERAPDRPHGGGRNRGPGDHDPPPGGGSRQRPEAGGRDRAGSAWPGEPGGDPDQHRLGEHQALGPRRSPDRRQPRGEGGARPARRPLSPPLRHPPGCHQRAG